MMKEWNEYAYSTRLSKAAPEMYKLLKELVCWKYDRTVTLNLASKAEKLLARIDGTEEQ